MPKIKARTTGSCFPKIKKSTKNAVKSPSENMGKKKKKTRVGGLRRQQRNLSIRQVIVCGKEKGKESGVTTEKTQDRKHRSWVKEKRGKLTKKKSQKKLGSMAGERRTKKHTGGGGKEPTTCYRKLGRGEGKGKLEGLTIEKSTQRKLRQGMDLRRGAFDQGNDRNSMQAIKMTEPRHQVEKRNLQKEPCKNQRCTGKVEEKKVCNTTKLRFILLSQVKKEKRTEPRIK